MAQQRLKGYWEEANASITLNGRITPKCCLVTIFKLQTTSYINLYELVPTDWRHLSLDFRRV